MAFIRRLYSEYLFLLLVLLSGVGTSIWTSWKYQENIQRNTIAEFQVAAQDRIELLSDKLAHIDVILRSVSAFFRASHDVSHEEFSTFTEQLLRDYSYIQAVEWIPKVTDKEREDYEKNALDPAFHFLEMGKDNELIPATRREEYFPIYYAEPFHENKEVLGFDIASDTKRNRALIHARDTKQIAATQRVELLQISEKNDKNTAGIIFYEPVYRDIQMDEAGNNKEYSYMSGFIGAVIPLADMIETAIKPLNYSGVNIVLYDLSAPSESDSFLYVRSTRLKDIPDEEILSDYHNPGYLLAKHIIDVGGRKWQITILPARGFFNLDINKGVYLTLLIGLLITGLLATYIYSRIRESERINEEVDERTHELSKAKRETEMILLSTQEGVTGLDRDGNITFCNPMASQIMGYGKKELIGQHHHTLVHSKHPDGTPYELESCPIQQVLEYGRPCNVRDEVFWRRDGTPIQIEYTASPIFESGEISGAVLIFRDITERLTLERKLEQMARYDHLTELANRSLFIELLKNALLRANRNKRMVGVVYLDLNGFKPINDTLGHAAGDILLQEFARWLKDLVRDSDTAARMGGDEFTILVDNLASEEECLILINRLKKGLEQPFNIAGQHFNIGASIGIAFYPDHSKDAEELIRLADSAMYIAKKDKSLPYVIYGKAN